MWFIAHFMRCRFMFRNMVKPDNPPPQLTLYNYQHRQQEHYEFSGRFVFLCKLCKNTATVLYVLPLYLFLSSKLAVCTLICCLLPHLITNQGSHPLHLLPDWCSTCSSPANPPETSCDKAALRSPSCWLSSRYCLPFVVF